ncbi:FAD/NAD(P)-binding protein [Streptomyces sp. enrichment culture]|uniref:FAD/NAD(P)-binding protein n=1 Tax=Streptomyces sp. enrichment culture TaxID=1795815 RepID=UPI003F572702
MSTVAAGRTPSIAIIGAGPRGTSILERMAANAAEFLPDGLLDVHVIDPCPAGGGHVWRRRQPALLWSNTRVDECTLFTDHTVDCDGPVVPGPTLAEWAAELSQGTLDLPDGYRPRPESLAEAKRVHDGWFGTRAFVGDYLAWVFWRTVRNSSPRIRVHTHQARTLDVRDLPGGRQRITLSGGETLDVDFVLHAQGNFPVRPRAGDELLARKAAAHQLTYVPPSSTADISLDPVHPGEPVIVRGLGLAFIDVMILLTEGRGGRFHREDDGELRYEPSGREPVIHAGSRRGVPYRCKFAYPLPRPVAEHSRYFRLAALESNRPLDFSSDLWPLIARELSEAGYRELATSHSDRLAMPPGTFLTRLSAVGWNTPEFKELIAHAVPHREDRIDIEAPDQPLTGRRFPDHAALQRWMTDYLATDLARGRDPRHSAHLAVYHALFSVMNTLWELVSKGRMSPGSGDRGIPAFLSMCRFLSSGPPAPRLEQLLALARCGIVRFLGAHTEISCRGGVFEARSHSVDELVRARALVEARLPRRALSLTTEPLLLRLLARGDIREETQIDPSTGRRHSTGVLDTVDGRPVRAGGRPHPVRLITGPGDFPRPRANSPFLRQSDAAARKALRTVTESL